MSYINRSLGDGEVIIARAHFHWLYATRAWLALLIPLVLLGVAYFMARSQPDPYTVGAAVLLAVGVIVFLHLMTRKWSTEIGVTSHRFVEKYGLMSMRTNEIALSNIEGVRVNQSVLGRIFGYGTVRIEGTGVDSVVTPIIANPVRFVRAIQTAREYRSAR